MSDTSRCVFCGRVTLQPVAFVGIYPVGRRCARKLSLGDLARAGGKGLVRRVSSAARASMARRDRKTRDLFEGIAA